MGFEFSGKRLGGRQIESFADFAVVQVAEQVFGVDSELDFTAGGENLFPMHFGGGCSPSLETSRGEREIGAFSKLALAWEVPAPAPEIERLATRKSGSCSAKSRQARK